MVSVHQISIFKRSELALLESMYYKHLGVCPFHYVLFICVQTHTSLTAEGMATLFLASSAEGIVASWTAKPFQLLTMFVVHGEIRCTWKTP